MYRQIYIVLFCINFVFLAACGNGADTITPSEPSTLIAKSTVVFGELQKSDGFTYGRVFQDTITVQNCDNPLPRSDSLTEARTVKRNISWNISGQVGGSAEASAIVAGAEVEAAISSGYELEVSDFLQRSRTIDLPVDSNSSVEYTIEWKPVVWNGILPFTFQGGEDRIEYLYERLVFGEVVNFIDKTSEQCGVTSDPPVVDAPPTKTPADTPSSEVISPTPTPTNTPKPPPIAAFNCQDNAPFLAQAQAINAGKYYLPAPEWNDMSPNAQVTVCIYDIFTESSIGQGVWQNANETFPAYAITRVNGNVIVMSVDWPSMKTFTEQAPIEFHNPHEMNDRVRGLIANDLAQFNGIIVYEHTQNYQPSGASATFYLSQ